MRKQSYVIGIRVAREWYDLARFFKVPDSKVFLKGLMAILEERISELSEEQINILIQYKRQELMEAQDFIALCERVALDARIREEKKTRVKVETRRDERGKAYQVVIAE